MNDYKTIQEVFNRDDFTCQYCGEGALGYNKNIQRAHILSQGKYSRKHFGKLIDSPLNMKTVCSLKCNNKLAVNYVTQPILAEKLAEAIKDNDLIEVNRLLIESGRMR